METHRNSDYRSTTALTLGLIASIGFFVVMSVVVMWSTAQELDLLGMAYQGSVLFDDWVYANDQRQAIVAGFAMLSFATTAGLFLWWIVAVTNNARGLTDDFRTSPIAAVAGHLIPGLHAWLPIRQMRALYRAAAPGSDATEGGTAVPRFLSLWWTLWLTFQLTVFVSMATDLLGPSIENLQLGASAAMLAAALAIPLSVATALAVWRLNVLQSRLAAARTAAQYEPQAGPWPGEAVQRI